MARLIRIASSYMFALYAVAGNTHGAMLRNCGFETGSFSSWSQVGGSDVLSVVDNSFGQNAPFGTYQALLMNGVRDNFPGTAGNPGRVEAALGLTVHDPTAIPPVEGTLDKFIPDGHGIGGPQHFSRQASYSAAIYQEFDGSAGDVVTFRWNFFTNEYDQEDPFNDFAFFSLVNTDPTGVSPLDTTTAFPSAIDGAVLLAKNDYAHHLVAEGLPPLVPVSPGTSPAFSLETGYRTTSIVLQSSGTFILGFGVVGAKDARFNSGFTVDMECNTVPEPSSWILTLLGMCLVIPFLYSRRRRLTTC